MKDIYSLSVSIEDQVGLGVSSRGERGTSSLQLTDSDEMNSAMAAVVTTASRKKRSESWYELKYSPVPSYDFPLYPNSILVFESNK